jgi:hypothetical protein
LSFATLARIAAAVGLDVWVRTYPGPEPIRDQGQATLGDSFLRSVNAPLIVRTEVRIGDRRDLRAWDLTIAEPAGRRCGVELETRFIDAQAQHCRISQKLADSGFDMVLVVVADTRANRAAVRAAAGYLGSDYVIDDPATLDALRNGRLPARSALIFVPTKGKGRLESRPTGADDTEPPLTRVISRAAGQRSRVSPVAGNASD